VRKGWAVLVALGFLAGNAEAVERRGRDAASRDEAFKMVVAYLLSNLQERLELTDQEYVRLLPLVQQRQNHRREMHEGREAAIHRLHELVGRSEAGEELNATIRELDRVENEGPKRLAADQAAIDTGLTVLQQAKYRLLEAEVERRVRELARRFSRGRDPRDQPPPAPEE
jgi:hypothetical protein